MVAPLIAAGIGIGAQYLGGQAAKQAATEGAVSQANIEALNRDFQQRMFDEEMARLMPRAETAQQIGLPMALQMQAQGGLQTGDYVPGMEYNPEYGPDELNAYSTALQQYEADQAQYAADTDIYEQLMAEHHAQMGQTPVPIAPEAPTSTMPYIDRTLSDMPLYRQQMDLGYQALEDQGITSDYARNRFRQGLGAAENDAVQARLGDLMQIGMGASESAGAGAQNFAAGQSGSFINTGNVLAQGQLRADNQQNAMYRNLAGQLGSLPAYSQYQQAGRDARADQYEASPGFVGPLQY